MEPIVLGGLLLALYMLPSILAVGNRHPHREAIVALNALSGAFWPAIGIFLGAWFGIENPPIYGLNGIERDPLYSLSMFLTPIIAILTAIWIGIGWIAAFVWSLIDIQREAPAARDDATTIDRRLPPVVSDRRAAAGGSSSARRQDAEDTR